MIAQIDASLEGKAFARVGQSGRGIGRVVHQHRGIVTKDTRQYLNTSNQSAAIFKGYQIMF